MTAASQDEPQGVPRRRPRVVIDGRYIDDHFPGVGRFCHALVRALADVELPFDVLVPVPAGRGGRLATAELAGPRLTLVPTRVPTLSLREQLALPRLARALRADLWHAPHPAVPLLLRCPTVVSCHDAIPLQHPETLAARWRRPAAALLLRRAVRAAAVVHTGSTAARDDVVALLGAPPERTVVIPHGVDHRFTPRPVAEIAALRSRLGVPERYVLHLSSGKPHKNVARLLAAWRLLDAAGALPSAVLAVAGDAGRPELYPPQHATVRWLGPVAEADLPALYAGALLVVMPSLREGFGLPVVEAMACGAPVVCSDASSLPETAGGAAELCDPRDEAAIAAALSRVAGDEERRAELRARGLARAATFTWEAAARRFAALYERVLGLSAAGGPR